MRPVGPVLLVPLLCACAGDATGRAWTAGGQIEDCARYCYAVEFWVQEQLPEPIDIVRGRNEPLLPEDGGIGLCACKVRPGP